MWKKMTGIHVFFSIFLSCENTVKTYIFCFNHSWFIHKNFLKTHLVKGTLHRIRAITSPSDIGNARNNRPSFWDDFLKYKGSNSTFNFIWGWDWLCHMLFYLESMIFVKKSVYWWISAYPMLETMALTQIKHVGPI